MSDLEELYRTAEGVRGGFGGDEQRAAGYFDDYIGFVAKSSPEPAGAILLDIGCGAGWSAFLFAQRGFQTTGVDLNRAAFEPPATPGLTLTEASALDLPFEDASFDVVTAYQTLEHIPDPGAALLQMLRVCKPGGLLCIVGPNLVSIGQALKCVGVALRHRPLRRVFFRTPDLPRHPYGNTLPEALRSVPLTIGRVVTKTLASGTHFTMRAPDLVPPFHADNDACYFCNPIDLAKFLPRHGARIVQNGAYGRPLVTASFAGGTWIAARKQDQSAAREQDQSAAREQDRPASGAQRGPE